MDKNEICASYQELLRQAYPRVVVMPCSNQWNPYQDECYDAFFVPDSAAGKEYSDHWHKEGGWYDQAEQKGLPNITLMQVYDHEVKEHYSHLFPEIFGKTASAKSKRIGSKPARKSSKAKPVRAKARASAS